MAYLSSLTIAQNDNIERIQKVFLRVILGDMYVSYGNMDGGGMRSPKRRSYTDWLSSLQTLPNKARGTAAPQPSSSPAGPSAGSETQKISKQPPPKKVKKWKQRENGTYGWLMSLAFQWIQKIPKYFILKKFGYQATFYKK